MITLGVSHPKYRHDLLNMTTACIAFACRKILEPHMLENVKLHFVMPTTSGYRAN